MQCQLIFHYFFFLLPALCFVQNTANTCSVCNTGPCFVPPNHQPPPPPPPQQQWKEKPCWNLWVCIPGHKCTRATVCLSPLPATALSAPIPSQHSNRPLQQQCCRILEVLVAPTNSLASAISSAAGWQGQPSIAGGCVRDLACPQQGSTPGVAA